MATVNVSVNSNNQISVDQPSLDMRSQGRNAEIQWNLNTTAWKFSASNGIAIDNNTGQFTQLQQTGNGTRYLCVDANSDGKTYKYTINLYNTQTPTQQISLDPSIINGGASLS